MEGHWIGQALSTALFGTPQKQVPRGGLKYRGRRRGGVVRAHQGEVRWEGRKPRKAVFSSRKPWQLDGEH